MDEGSVMDREQLLAEVAGLIREVIGEDWVLETPIGMATSFSADLELESIEIVALSEKVQDRYGEALDFAGWLSGMELDDIIGLTVGQLVEFIAAEFITTDA